MRQKEGIKARTVTRVKALVDYKSGYYVDKRGRKLEKCPAYILEKIKEASEPCKRT